MADEEKKPEASDGAPSGSDAPAKPETPAIGKSEGTEAKPAGSAPEEGAKAPVAGGPEPAKPAAAPPTPPAAPPAAGAAKPAPPAGAAKPPAAAPPKPAAPKPEPWDDEFARRVRDRYPDAIKDSLTYLGQNFFVVDAAQVVSLCEYLKIEEDFDYLVDVTAVDYPKREKRFEMIYQLYSFRHNVRLRLKAALGEGEEVQTVVPVWSTANWLEREAFDMFGIRFAGHPDLRRILLPEDWQGYPLRKDYGITQQDTQWVQENLHIESGQ